MNIKDMSATQKIIIILLIIAAAGICGSVISSRLPDDQVIIYDVDPVELYNNYRNYQGKQVRFAARYETLIPEHNAITFSEGLDDYRKCIYAWMEDGELPEHTEDYSSEYVVVCGKVKDCGVGNLNIVNCRLEAKGDEAYEFYKSHTKTFPEEKYDG